jgi:DNA-binding protein H-NS
MNLKSMPVHKLMDLRNRVQATLGAKATEARRMLQTKLTQLARAGNGISRGRAVLGSKVAPKYRNPDNPSETWAGRGLRPRWLAAALKGGKKLEHFAIAAPKAAVAKGAPKKTRRARKAQKKSA